MERVNRFLKSSLKKILEEVKDWSTVLDTVQYVVNNSFHKLIKTSPSKLFLEYDQRNHSDANLREYLKSHTKELTDCDQIRDSTTPIAIQAMNKIKDYNKLYYDENHSKPSHYNVSNYVLIKDSSVKVDENRKFKAPKGAYQVSKVLNKNRFVIIDIPGF